MDGAIVGAVICFAVSIACVIIGIMNTKGNISMLHSYHINNIKDEDKLPCGKLVGLGMIIVGFAIFIYGCAFIASELAKDSIYLTVGNIVLVVCLTIGLFIMLYAIKKYNKKIFG